jgi:hypothetical protein
MIWAMASSPNDPVQVYSGYGQSDKRQARDKKMPRSQRQYGCFRMLEIAGESSSWGIYHAKRKSVDSRGNHDDVGAEAIANSKALLK